MFTVKSGAGFIAELRTIDARLNHLKLNSVCVDRGSLSITYNFICDQAVDEELKGKLLDAVEKKTSGVFKIVEVKVVKIANDIELVSNSIYKYLSDNYPSISIFLKPTDVNSVKIGEVMKYTLRLTKDGVEYVNKNGAIERLNEYLSRNYCAEFVGGTEIKEQTETVDLTDERVFENELQRVEVRTIKVKEVLPIDDEYMGNTASYIEDVKTGEVTVCGKVTEITERQTKGEKPKPFFIIHLDDTTGRTSGLYFSKKSTYEKIKLIEVGDEIIVRGKIELRDGKPSFIMDKINRCVFPKDFVKQEKFKKTAPKEYQTVFPEQATTVKVDSVFDEYLPLPQDVIDTTFVVIDLETTGLDTLNDGITDIGAVKIVGGKITEQWATLVKPDKHISQEIEKLTGISDDTVKDAPKISVVFPDLMKFIEGSVVIAHNTEFDIKFIRRIANAEEYEFKNKILDTMDIAKKYLPELRRFDLKTIADRFGIVFHHHRGLTDAYATAEAFIEMMKIKAKQENIKEQK